VPPPVAATSARIRVGQTNERCSAGKDKTGGLDPLAARNRDVRIYQARRLGRDLGAGLVLTTALAPVGIAYALASGLPGACGLYATIVPLLVYALFGPSRILVLGPGSSLAAIILGVVARSPPETQIARSLWPV
jgi:MFS superfamily sulfate permease-like transporter